MIFWLSYTRGKDAPKEISMTANSSGKKGYQSQRLFLRSQVLKHLTHSKGIWQASVSCYSIVVKPCLVDAKTNFLQIWWQTGAECFFYGSGFAMSVAFYVWCGQLDYRRRSNQIFSTRICWRQDVADFLCNKKLYGAHKKTFWAFPSPVAYPKQWTWKERLKTIKCSIRLIKKLPAVITFNTSCLNLLSEILLARVSDAHHAAT